MLKNYLIVTIRNLLQNKTYTFINLLGFTIGIASCLLIMLYITHELSYDRFHVKADRIYRLGGEFRLGGAEGSSATSPVPAAAGFKAEFPEVEDATRLRNAGEQVVRHNDQLLNETGLLYADNNFFDVFDFELLLGDPATALLEPNTVVLTEETALKYFGDEAAINDVLTIGDNNTAYRVTGIVRNPPDNSHIDFEMLLSMASRGDGEMAQTAWGNFNLYTYLVLREGASLATLEAKIPSFYQSQMLPLMQEIGISWEAFLGQGNQIRLILQPLASIHLHSNLDSELQPGGNPANLYIFSAIALFILLIACINFMNLSTARSANRAKEIGIRKTLGSAHGNLVRQFLTESILFSILGMILAIVLVELFIIPFNNAAGIELAFSPFTHWWLAAGLIILTLLVGVLAGSYPAFYLAALKPVEVLKGEIRTGVKRGKFRSGLVVFQFAISIGLIVSTFFIYRQLEYINNKNLGFDKENVLIIPNAGRLGNQLAAFKQELQEQPQVINASISSGIPGRDSYGGTLYKGEPPENTDQGLSITEEDQDFQNFSADYDYIETMGMELMSGRNFSSEYSSDSAAFIINEAVARAFGWEDPVGKDIYVTGWDGQPRYQVIGVVRDYHLESLRNDIGPVVMSLGTTGQYLLVRIQPEDIRGSLAMIENKWREFAPNVPFDYSFLDDDFDFLLRDEQRFGQIVSAFTALTIFISCLGLFGLAAFAAERHTKEIGIRKVVGASVAQVVGLLSKEFLVLVLIANVIAWPVAWYAMRRWLEDFAYRIELGLGVFILAGLMALVIALVTVSWQTIRAATANPVEALRYE